jgi:hypothetical protein
LIALSVIVGVGLGGFRVLFRRLFRKEEEGPFLLLRIRDK